MGEKETGTATEEGERRQHGGNWRPSKQLGRDPASAGEGIEAGDVDGDGMPDAAVESGDPGGRQESHGVIVKQPGGGMPGGRQVAHGTGGGMPGGRQAAHARSPELENSGTVDPTPARVSEGGGDDIAIGDPGVNGN